jgi:NADPH:quinone reductase-like Zn-dependent oxidoreductase
MAQAVVAPSAHVYKVPRSLCQDLSDCTNIGRNSFAAYYSLKTICNVGPQSLVLVNQPSGGVGMAIFKLAIVMDALRSLPVSVR